MYKRLPAGHTAIAVPAVCIFLSFGRPADMSAAS
jgi:hypothetical protein